MLYILLGGIILSLIRIFGIVKSIKIRMQETDPKIHFIYEQLLNEKENDEKISQN